MVESLVSQEISTSFARPAGSMVGVVVGARTSTQGYLVTLRDNDLAILRMKAGNRGFGLVESVSIPNREDFVDREVTLKVERVGKSSLKAKVWPVGLEEPDWQLETQDISPFQGEGKGKVGLVVKWGEIEFLSFQAMERFPDIPVKHSIPVRPKVSVFLDGEAASNVSFKVLDPTTLALCGFQVAGRSGEVQVRAHLPSARSGMRRRP